jgi:4-hydroxy-L-threonine phosphate dehydrogenase PdxA
MHSKPIVIVPCEFKSVFFELFFNVLKKKKFKNPLLLICSNKNLKRQMKKYNFYKKLKLLKVNELSNIKIDNRAINLIDINFNNNFKNPNLNYTKKYYEKCFSIAFEIIKKGITNKLLNGPINKKKILNKKFNGVTEFISDKFNRKNIGMLIYNKNLSVCPLTTHLPIKLVPKNIKKKQIEIKIKLIDLFYKKILKIKPKIAVTGLNPHCESNLKNNEDETIIKPVIKKLKKNGLKISGPFPADTIFLRQNRKKYNVVLGMYHDQVLAPLKTLYEYDAVNITMGLPFLRVSPDHGPNEKMVNKNLSNPLSLTRALEFLDQN